MKAKLYRVTVTKLWGSGRKAEVNEWWVAAGSPLQARRIAIAQTWPKHIADRTHVHVSNWRGGFAHIKSTMLVPETSQGLHA